MKKNTHIKDEYSMEELLSDAVLDEILDELESEIPLFKIAEADFECAPGYRQISMYECPKDLEEFLHSRGWQLSREEYKFIEAWLHSYWDLSDSWVVVIDEVEEWIGIEYVGERRDYLYLLN